VLPSHISAELEDEYWYQLDQVNTGKLMAALGAEEDGFAKALAQHFPGWMG